MTRLLLCVALGLAAPAAHAQFQPPADPAVPTVAANDAKTALSAVPARFGGGIVRLSADNGTPNPPAWYVLAKKAEGELFSLTISDGQITAEKPSLNLRALVGNPSPINLARVTVGSNDAWRIATDYCAKKGKTLASVSYVLQQKGADSVPVWSVWCYDARGESIGELDILASTGKVIPRD